jgi:hypothetical protein
MQNCGPVHGVVDAVTDVEIVAPDEVGQFVAAHGGRLFVWVSAHPGMLYVPCLLETSLEPPHKRDLSFRRVEAPGFELYLDASQQIWPKMMEFGLHRHRRVDAFWNGLAWVA